MKALGWGRSLFIAVAALQVLVILSFAGYRELLVRVGQEVVLETVPVDPRDLFRGDYVTLRYRVSSLLSCQEAAVGQTVYVPISKGADGVTYEGSFARLSVSDALKELGLDDVFLRGRVVRGAPVQACEVEYGIESYFVPEGTGKEIERLRGQLKVRVSVNEDGQAVIKGLILP